MLISAVKQSDSVIHIYILLHILFHYGLSQDILTRISFSQNVKGKAIEMELQAEGTV